VKIDIQFRPIEVMRERTLHLRELCDRRLAKPRKLLEGQEALFLVQQEPESVLRDVRNFSC